MQRLKSTNPVRLLLAVPALLAFAVLPALADKVVVSSRTSTGALTAYPPYQEVGTFINSSGNLTVTVDTPSAVGCRFGSGAGGAVAFKVKPTLANLGHTYKVDITGPVTSSTFDVAVDISTSDGVLNTNKTDAFSVKGINGSCQWTNACYITNITTLTPEITFTYSATLMDNTTAQDVCGYSRRFFAGAVRFTDVADICGTVPVPGQVLGPLSNGQTAVQLSGCSTSATKAAVYADGVKIGEGPTGGAANPTVTVTPLVKGKKIVATQTINGIESCPPTSSTIGPVVGGGANPAAGIRVSLVLQQNASLTGPIGASTIVGTADAGLYHKPCTGVPGGYGTAPAGGVVITPSTCWQTVTINPNDTAWGMTLNSGNGPITDPNAYAALCGLSFSLPTGSDDTGPYVIYVDRIMNGTTIVQDFEGYPDATDRLLLGYPSAAGIIGNDTINAPNISHTTTSQFADGTSSAMFSFQFKGVAANYWQRAVLNGNYQTNPVVDITQPISLHLLMLPVSGGTGHFLGDASVSPASTTNCPGANVSFTASVTGGTGPFTYQWKRDGTTIAGATTSTFSTNNVTAASSGTYSCVINDGSACSASPAGILTVPTAVQIDTQPADNGVQADGTGYANFSAGASIPAICPCAKNPNIAYRWMFNGVPLSDGGNISGASGSGLDLVAPSLTINPTYYANAGNYSVVVSNLCTGQSVTSAVARLWVTPHQAITVACSPSGLTDLDYTNKTSASPFTGAPAATNAIMGAANAPVDYNWETNSFGYNMGVFPDATNYFTLRFIGTFQPPYDPGTGQLYTFRTLSDDGLRLYVDGELVINSWIDQGGTVERTGSILLKTNNPVDLILEFYEKEGGAQVHLSYSSPSIAPVVIPASQLCPADPSTSIPPFVTLTAPANNFTSTLGTPVTLTASVTQQSATVNKVEFYNNGTNLIATVTQTGSGTYSTSWTPPALGIYNISARVIYNTTHKLNSVAVNKLTVAVPQSPVTISSITPTTVSYGGGGGLQFVLLQSSSVTAQLSSWTRVATNTVTPGSFSISPAPGPAFYSIKSE